MQNISKLLLSILVFTIFISCSNDDSTIEIIVEPAEFYEELNISYGSDSDQVFDLYLPANRTRSTKTILLVHGGAWRAGDKVNMDLYKDYILQNLPEVAIVNMNYRLANSSSLPYPMQINDITSVVNYISSRQDEYMISDEIGFIGSSAGAHLSLLWSYAFDSVSQTNMVCSIVGPTNFTDPAYLDDPSATMQQLLAVLGPDTTTAYLEEISPFHQVTASAPPTILFYGGLDVLIPTTQGTDLHTRLNNLGVINEFTLYPNEGHGWNGAELLDTTLKLHTFIETHL